MWANLEDKFTKKHKIGQEIMIDCIPREKELIYKHRRSAMLCRYNNSTANYFDRNPRVGKLALRWEKESDRKIKVKPIVRCK